MGKTTVQPTDQGYEYWRTRPYLSDETRDAVKNAPVLIVPTEGFREQDIRVFPVQTEELFHFLREKMPPEATVEIVINDKDYKELALHGALLIVGSIVAGGATLFAIPVLVNVVSEYINRRLFTENEQKTTDVRWELTVVDGTKATKLTYEGPAIDFRTEMLTAIAQLPSSQTENEPIVIEGTVSDAKS
jgi:hypothetical protein